MSLNVLSLISFYNLLTAGDCQREHHPPAGGWGVRRRLLYRMLAGGLLSCVKTKAPSAEESSARRPRAATSPARLCPGNWRTTTMSNISAILQSDVSVKHPGSRAARATLAFHRIHPHLGPPNKESAQGKKNLMGRLVQETYLEQIETSHSFFLFVRRLELPVWCFKSQSECFL